MKRIIIDYKKLTKDILKLLIEKYPDGYDNSDIISFKNLQGETIKAVELRDSDTIYLVKVGSQLEKTMDNLIDEEEEIVDDEIIDDEIE